MKQNKHVDEPLVKKRGGWTEVCCSTLKIHPFEKRLIGHAAKLFLFLENIFSALTQG